MKKLEPITELISQILDNWQTAHSKSAHEKTKQKNSDI